jgi:hypothetical protein
MSQARNVKLVFPATRFKVESHTPPWVYAEQPFSFKEVVVPVVAVFQSPSLTREKYEETVRKITGGRGRMESPSDWPVAGLLVHAAGEGAEGFRVVDVWESEEACRRFGERLMPVLQAVGVEGQPEIYKTHTFVSARDTSEGSKHAR